MHAPLWSAFTEVLTISLYSTQVKQQIAGKPHKNVEEWLCIEEALHSINEGTCDTDYIPFIQQKPVFHVSFLLFSLTVKTQFPLSGS